MKEKENDEDEDKEEDQLDNEDKDNYDQQGIDELEQRRRCRDVLQLRLHDFATKARSKRNRILDWAEILMGLEDNLIEFHLEVSESDRYIGNPKDYVDAAGYEALLQTLAKSDSGGRRGAPPVSKSTISELPAVKILWENEALLCAICPYMVNVGEMAKTLPYGNGYHGDCIVQWMGSSNSCPVCRFELPMDDPEYKAERKNKAVSPPRASGLGGSNSVSN